MSEAICGNGRSAACGRWTGRPRISLRSSGLRSRTRPAQHKALNIAPACPQDRRQRPCSLGGRPVRGPTEAFDYIIVGAGSAGCVLAHRLTASGRHRVLLLEAGGEDRNIWIHIPLGYGKLFANPKVNWLYSSEPEPELNDRRIIQPRGKVLGGSSSINGLLYIRGQHEDFDHWRQLGNAGWSFADVLPYFRRAEDQERGEDAWHGVGGPLAVSNVSEPHPLCEAFLTAVEQAGYPRPARRRHNLVVTANALTRRILFDGRRAIGVEYLEGGATRTAHAAGEV